MTKHKRFIYIETKPANEENCKILKDYIPVEFIDGLSGRILRFENPISGVSIEVIEEYGEFYISEPYCNDKLKDLDRDTFRYGKFIGEEV